MSLCDCGSPYCQGCPATDRFKENLEAMTAERDRWRAMHAAASEKEALAERQNKDLLDIIGRIRAAAAALAPNATDVWSLCVEAMTKYGKH